MSMKAMNRYSQDTSSCIDGGRDDRPLSFRAGRRILFVEGDFKLLAFWW